MVGLFALLGPFAASGAGCCGWSAAGRFAIIIVPMPAFCGAGAGMGAVCTSSTYSDSIASALDAAGMGASLLMVARTFAGGGTPIIVCFALTNARGAGSISGIVCAAGGTTGSVAAAAASAA